MESRTREDSLHYAQGELALGRQEIDLALSHHLAAELPAAGNFRDDLLVQRSRIFERLWPSAAPDSKGKDDLDDEARSRRPAFDWGASAGHSRGLDQAGPLPPDGKAGAGIESREWTYTAYARQSWPVSLGNQDLHLGLSANANRSSLGGASAYEAALEAGMPDGMLKNLFLSFSSGFAQAQDWGSYRYFGLLASKAWYFMDANASFEAGFSKQWDGGWKGLGENAWTKAGRDFPLAGGDNFHASLEAAANRQGSQPGSYFSFSPAFSYAFAMPAGCQAQAGAWYALDTYADYRTGLDLKLRKDLPHGYFLSVESSLELGWTNPARTGPDAFQPWRWGMSLNAGRSSGR
ncbi:MAG: hypothetical protein JF616_19255 [Fibrobacteres bacterium]|nr:hypothetical protein [Fibrobacterota bacterium]